MQYPITFHLSPMALLSLGGRTAGGRQTFAYRIPIDIREKRLDIFRTVDGSVILDKRVFPHVHYQDRLVSGDVALISSKTLF